MQLNFINKLDYFIYFIIFIKIIFIISALGYIISSHSQNEYLKTILDPKFKYWRDRTEFIFTASNAALLIYFFKPGTNHKINSETSILFFLFGWILLFTANWNLFFKEAHWYHFISRAWA
jgi:hypothetical protein